MYRGRRRRVVGERGGGRGGLLDVIMTNTAIFHIISLFNFLFFHIFHIFPHFNLLFFHI
jgi:hypothetical protein